MKVRTVLSVFILLQIIFLLSACVSAYFPSTVYVPNLDEKKEKEIKVQIGLSGLETQVGYALTDHIVLTGNLKYKQSFSFDYRESLYDAFKYPRVLFEGGAGYMTKVGKYGHFSVIGGAGVAYYNRWRSTFGDGIKDIPGRYYKYYAQPSLGIGNEYGRISGSLRYNHLIISEDVNQYSGVLLEPAFTLDIGPPHLRGTMQVSRSYTLLGDKNFEKRLFPYYISVGVSVKFKTLKDLLNEMNLK